MTKRSNQTMGSQDVDSMDRLFPDENFSGKKKEAAMSMSRFRGYVIFSPVLAVVMFILFILLTFVYSPHPLFAANVSATKHNLSTSGPGPVKATTEQRVCVFCHTPHKAIVDIGGIGVPLWNHSLTSPAVLYDLYTSGTLLSPTSPAIQPDGASKLCLSCHDGTVAVGSVVNLGGVATTISMQDAGTGYLTGDGKLSATAPGFVGTNLSGHHPISIAVNNQLLNDKNTQCINFEVSWRVCYPLTSNPGKLSKTNNLYSGSSGLNGNGVQCTSCHDPHTDPTPGTTLFLRGAPAVDKDNTDQLCYSCHQDCSSGCP